MGFIVRNPGTGKLCEDCYKNGLKVLQVMTPSGTSCKYGHGGTDGIEDPDDVAAPPAPARRPPRGPGAAKSYTLGVARESALSTAHRLKLSIPDVPLNEDGDPAGSISMPPDITAISLENLGRLYGQYSSMYGYTAAQVGLADVDAHEAATALGRLKARLTLSVDGKNADERAAKVQLDPVYIEVQDILESARARFVLLQQLLERYKDGKATLSRELTRRGVEVQDR